MHYLETCYFPYIRGENSTECNITFLEKYPIASHRIKLCVCIPGYLVLLISVFTLYNSRFSREGNLLRANLYTLFCGALGCVFIMLFNVNGLFFEKGFESEEARLQAFTLFCGSAFVALSQINFFPVLKHLLGISSFSARDESLLNVSTKIGVPYSVLQIPIMGYLLTLEDTDIYNFLAAYFVLFFVNIFNLAFPPYAISNVLISRLEQLQKNSGPGETTNNATRIKLKIRYFRQNSIGMVIGGTVAILTTFNRRWVQNETVFIVLIVFLCTSYQVYIPTLAIYSKYVLPGRKLRGIGRRDSTQGDSRGTAGFISIRESSRVTPQIDKAKQ
eukprot:snap_masked-scaffold_41-processed-gene-2.67-mRNA-1 protein AED:1.00 eAED:1.00 QI:0/0/0/0/1/1/2/0/330